MKNLKERLNRITGRYSGKIIKLLDGYGFIEFDDKTIYFHKTGLIRAHFGKLSEGDRLSFEVAENERGPAAVCIVKLEK